MSPRTIEVAPLDHESLRGPFALALIVTIGTIVIHGLIVGKIVGVVRRDLQRGRIGNGFWADLAFVAGATPPASVGHFIEIGLWPAAIELVGEFSNFGTAFYHSASTTRLLVMEIS